jgi:hypothetical protein
MKSPCARGPGSETHAGYLKAFRKNGSDPGRFQANQRSSAQSALFFLALRGGARYSCCLATVVMLPMLNIVAFSCQAAEASGPRIRPSGNLTSLEYFLNGSLPFRAIARAFSR